MSRVSATADAAALQKQELEATRTHEEGKGVGWRSLRACDGV